MTDGIAVGSMAVSPLSERYEMLRSAALGAELAVEARGGLALFLRRGMWGWARAVLIPSTPGRQLRSLVPMPTPQAEQQAVIHLFAAMAMRSNPRRAHERISQSAVASPGA